MIAKSLLSFLKKKENKSQKVEQIESIKFVFRKNALSRYIRISIKPDKYVLVSMPKRASFCAARKFAIDNIDEIKNALDKIKPKKYVLDGVEFDTSSNYVLALKKKAKEILPKRLDELALRYGYKYNKVALKYMKTRWGSCSFKNNINLNVSLVTLDGELIDYVLLHELVHTVEKNHAKTFWARINSHMPDARKRQKILKSRKVI